MEDIPDLESKQRFYADEFDSSLAVAQYVADNYAELSSLTKLWVDTWYDSTLPHWLLNRTFANTSTLATQTCHRFDDGRFWAWEGVDCCPGTCQHVWHYAQTVARIFPALERAQRAEVDYEIAYGTDGSMAYRAEASGHRDGVSEFDAEQFFAADGQLGTIIRVYREHSMAPDDSFLSGIWPRVKQSLRFMMTLDSNGTGLLDAPQYNTLDTTFHGRIPWISSLYLAALAAGKSLAQDMDDFEFVQMCDERLQPGKVRLVEELFNGEYFVHKADPSEPASLDFTEGSYIDQVLGQSLAGQLGLERVIPPEQSRSALKALWKYNYLPDVGPYREGFKAVEGGRWYAMPGEGGLLMCTWPKDDYKPREPTKLGLDVTTDGYLNECMSGFEYQVASHMIEEGLVEEGLAVTRSIHDRYHASKRNPWNEVECSDHYSRAMASYGVFLAMSGFKYHGPRGEIEFHPKMTPEAFRCAFTCAGGWGSFSQVISGDTRVVELDVRVGVVTLTRFSLGGVDADLVSGEVSLEQNSVTAAVTQDEDKVSYVFATPVEVGRGQALKLRLQFS